MKNKSKVFVRRKPINWSERGVKSWIADIESMCNLASKYTLVDYNHLIYTYKEPGRIYFSLAARSRAAACHAREKEDIDRELFRARTLIETSMIKAISLNSAPFFDLIFKKGFFGYSIKQGVTVRFPLSSCKPTKRCGSGCYAHDGRDKHLASIARGVFNYLAVDYLERDNFRKINSHNLSLFLSQIDVAIKCAKIDAQKSMLNGFKRRPRIRLSHVGELASSPSMANWLANQIYTRSSGEVDSIIYTRHPNAGMLDTKAMIVNFTLEGANDLRAKFVPNGARIVNSAWDGNINETAEVNFLEHHVKKASSAKGVGTICPVTAHHSSTPTCDSARCIKCFIK